MITKKWVEEKLEEVERRTKGVEKRAYQDLVTHTASNQKIADEVREQIGYHSSGFIFSGLSAPEVSVAKQINAICAYLGIEIVKEQKAEAIVARKIKKAK